MLDGKCRDKGLPADLGCVTVSFPITHSDQGSVFWPKEHLSLECSRFLFFAIIRNLLSFNVPLLAKTTMMLI